MQRIKPALSELNWLRTVQWLLYFMASVWVLLGLSTAWRMAESQPAAGWVLAGLMAGNAAAMALAGFGLQLPRRVFYWFALLVLLVNVILSVTDQFGFLDLVTMLIDMVIMAILIVRRRALPAWRK